jgi:hypothetical protein
MGFHNEIHARQGRGLVYVQQVFFCTFDIAEHKELLIDIGGKVFRSE